MHTESLSSARVAVRYILGEVSGPDEPVFVGDDLIDLKVLEALRFVKLHAASVLMEADVCLTSDKTDVFDECEDLVQGYLVGVFSLPRSSFLRLLDAWYDDWSFRPDVALYAHDRAYAKLGDPYTTGTPLSPVVSVVDDDLGRDAKTEIRLYTKPKWACKAHVRYVEPPTVSDSGDISVPLKLVDAMHYYAAGLCLLSLADNRAQELMGYGMGLMGVSNNKDK